MLSHPFKIKTFLVSVYIWSVIVLTTPVLFLLYMIIWFLAFPFDRNHVVSHYFTFLWTRIYLTCNPEWKLHIVNRKRIDPAKTYILVSNHQSIIDIALLLQLRINFKWVSKIELAPIPFVGWVIWMNNHILVKRGDKKSVLKMADACRETLARGISVFMFPEGTRSTNGKIQAFKEGAFILAKENQVPILPVVIDGGGQALSRHSFLFTPGVRFHVHVLDEISPEKVNKMELPELMSYTHRKMTDELNIIRNGTGYGKHTFRHTAENGIPVGQ